MSKSIRTAIAASMLGLLAAQPASSATIIDFGSSPAGPITNNTGGNGDFSGTEYQSLGIVFVAAPGDILNIGSGTGVGDPANSLGADLGGFANNFSGVLTAMFTLGGVNQVTDSVILDYVNNNSRTIIRNRAGMVLLDQATGDVTFSTTGIASIESRFRVDAIGTFTFGNLSPAGPNAVPEPATMTPAIVAGLALAGYGWRRRQRAA